MEDPHDYVDNELIRLVSSRGELVCFMSTMDFMSLLALQNLPEPLPRYQDVPPEGVPILTLYDSMNRKIGTAKMYEVEHVMSPHEDRLDMPD